MTFEQLVGVDTNGVVSSYAYAPDGLRHSKTVGGNTTTFVYDNANVIEEITADGINKYYRGFEIINVKKVKKVKKGDVPVFAHFN